MDTSTFEPLVRTSSPALDAILGEKFPVLDDIGFLRCIDYMGNDASVVQAARVSYGEGTKSVSDDAALIRYLKRHRHNTPFEMATIKFHVKCPIFVARQWFRHRSGAFNEISGRYSVLKDEFYIPAEDVIAKQSAVNKQGTGDAFTYDEADRIAYAVRVSSEESFVDYASLLSYGMAREQARIILLLNTYTEFYWTVNLHNLLHFLSLRADSHAQYEIRLYAYTLQDMVKAWVPMTYQAFLDYQMNAATLSGPALRLLRDYLWSDEVDLPTQEESGLGKREYGEFLKVLGYPEGRNSHVVG